MSSFPTYSRKDTNQFTQTHTHLKDGNIVTASVFGPPFRFLFCVFLTTDKSNFLSCHVWAFFSPPSTMSAVLSTEYSCYLLLYIDRRMQIWVRRKFCYSFHVWLCPTDTWVTVDDILYNIKLDHIQCCYVFSRCTTIATVSLYYIKMLTFILIIYKICQQVIFLSH